MARSTVLNARSLQRIAEQANRQKSAERQEYDKKNVKRLKNEARVEAARERELFKEKVEELKAAILEVAKDGSTSMALMTLGDSDLSSGAPRPYDYRRYETLKEFDPNWLKGSSGKLYKHFCKNKGFTFSVRVVEVDGKFHHDGDGGGWHDKETRFELVIHWSKKSTAK